MTNAEVLVRMNGRRSGTIRELMSHRALFAVIAAMFITLSLPVLGQNTTSIGVGKINIFAGQTPTDTGSPFCPSGSSYGYDNVPLSLSCIPAGASGTIMDSAGNIYFASITDNNIYVIYSGTSEPSLLKLRTDVSPQAGYVYRIAGTTSDLSCNPNEDITCGDGGLAVNAKFNFSGLLNVSLAFDTNGNLYIADYGDNAIRKIDASSGIISTVVGDNTHQYAGYGAYSSAVISLLYGPDGIAFDSSGNLYISDSNNFIISEVNLQSQTITVVAGTPPTPWNGLASNGPTSTGAPCLGGSCGDGGNATSAQLCYAFGVSVNSAGDILIADCSAVRKVNSASAKTGAGTINTVAGQLTASDGSFPAVCDSSKIPNCNDGQPATSAFLGSPTFVYQDPGGNLLIADSGASSLRVVDTSGIINAAVGQTGMAGYAGDGGTANQALLNGPASFTFDSSGNLYVADSLNGLIREVTAPPPLKQQTITYSGPTSVTYGSAALDLSQDFVPTDPSTGNPNGLSISSFTLGSGSPGTLNGFLLTTTGTGTISVTATQDGDSTWSPATLKQSISVTPATLTATASNLTLQDGQPIPANLPYAFSGFASGDTQSSVVKGTPIVEVIDAKGSPIPAGTVPAPGAYTIRIAKGTLSVNQNYTLNFVNGSLLVTQGQSQTVNITGFTPPATYGDANSSFSFNATASSGQPVDVAFTGTAPVKTQQTSSGWSVTVAGAGTVVITATQAGNTQYAPATATKSFTVNPAPLTVTVNNLQTSFGTIPAFTCSARTFADCTLSGFVGGDTTAVISGGATIKTTATTSSDPGQYPITLTQGTLFSQNYTFKFLNGTLTVNPASQQINNFAAPASVQYPTPGTVSAYPLTASTNSGLLIQYSATGAVAINPDGASFAAIGVGPASITAMASGDTDYAPTSATINFTVGMGVLEIHALDTSRPYGADNPQFGYDFGPGNPAPPANLLSGAPVFSTPAASDSPTGMYPIIPAIGTLSSPVYSFNFVNGTLTITQPSTYTLTVSPAAVTVPRGQSRQVTITLTPINNYSGSVTIGCSGLPVGVTCTASPAQLTPPVSSATGNANSINGTLTISAGQAVASTVPVSSQNNMLAASFFYLPGTLSGLILIFRRKQLRKSPLLFGIFLVLVLMTTTTSFLACGGGSSSTGTVAAGTTQIMITGSGTESAGTGNVSATVGLTVTIQ